MILECSCGHRFSRRSAVNGGAFRCPACDETVIVPGEMVNPPYEGPSPPRWEDCPESRPERRNKLLVAWRIGRWIFEGIVAVVLWPFRFLFGFLNAVYEILTAGMPK